jgi:EAL and modified HD-GYP domain-containing signal transduction protein
MFGLFRKLLGKSEPVEAPLQKDTRFDVLNKIAPLRSSSPADTVPSPNSPNSPNSPDLPTAAAAAPAHSFVSREPVLNRNEQIAGYEFSLHEKTQLRLKGEMDLLQKVYDDALLRNLTSLGVNALLGSRLAFVRLSPVSLGNPLIQQLPVNNTVLMLAPARMALDPAHLQPQLDTLRQAGFSYGWLLRKTQMDEHPGLPALAASADYVQIEAAGFDGMEIKLLLKSLLAARPAGLPKIRLIAHELNTFEEFHLCFEGGFDFFLGQFITSRENWHPPKSDINRLRVIELLNLLRGGAEFDIIAKQLKYDPVLTFKLLRYLNSPLMGLQSPVATMDKALIVLGRERFYRWLSLLLFDIKAPGYRERIFTEQALARASFLESLAGQGNLPAQKDQLFMLGLFSLLELLIGQPIEAILAQTRLPEAVHAALLGQPGPYRDALLLAIAAEDRSPQEIEQLAGICGLDALRVSLGSVEALTWANEITSMNDG